MECSTLDSILNARTTTRQDGDIALIVQAKDANWTKEMTQMHRLELVFKDRLPQWKWVPGGQNILQVGLELALRTARPSKQYGLALKKYPVIYCTSFDFNISHLHIIIDIYSFVLSWAKLLTDSAATTIPITASKSIPATSHTPSN